MRLSEIITRVREAVQDTNSNRKNWSDAKVGAAVNEAIRSLMRHAVEADPSYHNFQLELPASGAVEKSSGQYHYTLPRWVVTVAEVREKASSGTPEGTRLHRMRSRDEREGWMLERTKVLRLHRSSALDLTLYVAKLPARLTKGTLPDQAALGTLRLDADAAAVDFPHDSEEDIYGNAVFELTNTERVGTFAIGASSTARNLDTSVYYTDVVLDRDMAGKVAGDTYEMHSEIPDEHITVVVLHAAMKLWGSTSNQSAMTAHAQEYQYELRRYIESLQPRQVDGPLGWQSEGEDPTVLRRDPDAMNIYPFN